MSRRALLILIVILIAAGPQLVTNGQGPAPKPKKSLHDRAKKAGGKLILTYQPARTTVYPNIEEMAKRSDLIVVGRVMSHKANLTQDESFITQDYLVKVREVIKGELPKSTAVLVSVAGGTHRFDDGSYVAMMPVGYKPIKDGGFYVFFLKSKQKRSIFKGFRLVSETQGVFALTNERVEAADLESTDPIAVKYRSMKPGAFLQHIHRAAPRKINSNGKAPKK